MKKTNPEAEERAGEENLHGGNADEQELQADKQAKANEFRYYLRDLRRSHRLTQHQLAQKARVSPGYAGFFEQGRQTPPENYGAARRRPGCGLSGDAEKAGIEVRETDEAIAREVHITAAAARQRP
ncbi:MAG: helix-turn-helix transcriptional regulator [Bryobacteraceae bacterium]